MLVLTRKINEKIVISADIVVTVLTVDGDQVRLGIEAPSDISVHRQEVFDEIIRSNRQAIQKSNNRADILQSILSGRSKGNG